MFSYIFLGLGIGLAGSFHCIGMCGPLALSLPLHETNRFKRILSISLYNLGRAFTYFLLGLFFGLIGNSVFLIGYQQILSVAIGVIILLIVLFGKRMSINIPLFNRFNQKVKLTLAKLLHGAKNTATYFFIGNVNGLLPCGLVYLAIASAVATGSVLGGGLLMMAFGLGTIPLMFGLMIAGRYVSLAVRQKMHQLVPVFVGIMACLLILRGLNLGIPYISPGFDKSKTEVDISCAPDSVQVKP